MLTSRIDRPECVPPPTETLSLSLATKRIRSNGICSQSESTWQKVVSWLCPLLMVPTTSSTLAVVAHFQLGALTWETRW